MLRGTATTKLLSALFLIAVVAFGMAAAADARRKPTKREHRAVSKVMKIPAGCTSVRISTVRGKRKWASLQWRPRRGCARYAADGVVLLKQRRKRGARWRFVAAGSAFECKGLHHQVPRKVVKDLRVGCVP